MAAPLFTRGGSRSWTGSRLVLGGLLALAVVFGMLAMHNLHLDSAATGHSSSTAQGSSASHGSSKGHSFSISQSSTADALILQGQAPPALAVTGHAGQVDSADMACANCSPGELSMALNCLAAVVLGMLLLLPGKWRTGHTLPLLRAGPGLRGGELVLRKTPSLKVLCINRC